jgi:hypothetical protein
MAITEALRLALPSDASLGQPYRWAIFFCEKFQSVLVLRPLTLSSRFEEKKLVCTCRDTDIDSQFT